MKNRQSDELLTYEQYSKNMKNITIILVEPENPGNTGAICRVMKNFDFENLLLLGPKFQINATDLRNRAKWANDLVDKVKIVKKYSKKTLEDLDFDYLIATTARLGRDYNILRSPITPEQLAHKAQNNKKIGIVIGREGTGLDNEEIRQCDFTVTIPTSKEYGTMNISHAVTVLLYEIFKNSGKENIISHISPISAKEKEQISKMIDGILDRTHFTTKERKETQRMLWQKILGRSMLSKREAYALMGFLRKMR
jgi:tRNA/rRNA methyltransferase